MNWEEIKAWLEANKGNNAEIAAYLKALFPISMDGVKDFLESTEEGKTFMSREKDKHFTKGLATWQTNNLPALIDAKVKELHPEMTEEQKRIANLEKEIADAKAEAQREKLTNKALTVLGEKKLPDKLVHFLLGEDEEKTLANIAFLEEVFEPHISARVDERFSENGYQPGKGNEGGGGVKSFSDVIRGAQIRQD